MCPRAQKASPCSMNVLFNSEGARASCNCDSLQCDSAVSITRPMCGTLLELPLASVEPVARERKSRVRGRPPDSQPEKQYTDLVPMRQAQHLQYVQLVTTLVTHTHLFNELPLKIINWIHVSQ